MDDKMARKGEAPAPSPDDLLSTQDIMEIYGISRSAVRQWRLAPAKEVPFGKDRVIRFYWRHEVEAYAQSQRRLNRLPKHKN